LHKNLQPRRNGEDGQPLPLKVQFRLVDKMSYVSIGSVMDCFQIMLVARLSLSSEFEVELLYKHDLEGETLAAEIGRIKGQLIEMAREQGCKLVS
jgi:hypothetical protein